MPADDRTPASEVTLQLRAPAAGANLPVVALADSPRSPTAAVFGSATPAPPTDSFPGVPAMDPADPGSTGMLRLQDLDERFAESVFGGKDDPRK